MDVQKELEKWKLEFREANTPEKEADHKKRFNEFLKSLSEEDGKILLGIYARSA